MVRLLLPLALILALLFAAAVSDRPQPRADWTYIDAQPVFTLDPVRTSYEQDIRINNALWDGLVRWDPVDFSVVPGIAERWDVSPDKTRFTFHLRADARWSNGEPITAHDVVYSWRRGLSPDTAADYSKLFFYIRGGAAFFRWRAEQLKTYAARDAAERTPTAALALREETHRRFTEMVGLRADSPRTLVVEMERPTPYFLDVCAFVPTFPVYPPAIEAHLRVDPDSGRVEEQSAWTKPPGMVCSGAYTLSSWRFKRDMRLIRNPQYWNTDNVRADSIRVINVEDANTSVLAFKTGAADFATDVLTDYVGDMLRDADSAPPGSRRTIHGFSRFGTYFWSFNCTPTLTSGMPNPFHDPRVRKAFALAVDKRQIVENVRGVGEEPADTLIPPGSIPGFDPRRLIRGAAHNPDEARRLLALAGWSRTQDAGPPVDAAGSPFPVVEMLCSTGSYHVAVALAMGAMWERELGVRTRIVAKETKTYRQDLKRRDYMLARGGWFGDYNDPTTFLNLHRTGDGNNDRGYSSPQFDELMARAASETDDDARMRLLEDAERLTMEEELPVLPVWRYRQFFLYDDAAFTGVVTHPRMMQMLQVMGPGHILSPNQRRAGRADPAPTPARADGGAAP